MRSSGNPPLCLSGLPQGLGWISGRPHGQIRPSCGPTARAMMLVDRSDEKKWCHRASLRSTSCSGKTTVPSGSTSNSGACANRASSGQLEDVRHPCITRGQWGGMPRPWRPTAGSCRRRQARAMKGRRTTLKHRRSPQIGARPPFFRQGLQNTWCTSCSPSRACNLTAARTRHGRGGP